MRVWKRIVSGGLCGALLAGLLTAGASAAGFSRSKTYTPGQFTDVAANAWYAASVKDCYELGLMSGSSATTFNPSGLFTLAEAATIAARMHNIYNGGNGTIPSAAGAWYQGAVDYCVKNGIVGEGQYSTYTRNATRAEMAGMMAAALPESAWTAKNNVTALPDVNPMTDHSEAIFTLYNAGVFTGSDVYGKFQPYAYITRAEVAAIAARCADEGQRKVLNLTPMSQAEAPVIPGSGFGKMSQGRLAFCEEGKGWGYLDAAGTIVIPAQFDKDCKFEGGCARVGKDDKYGLIDLNGNVVVPFAYDEIYYLGDGVYELYDKVYKDGYSDHDEYSLFINGRVVTKKPYQRYGWYVNEGIVSLGDGLFGVYYGGGYGVINTEGAEIVPLKYSYRGIKHVGTYICAYDEDTNQTDIYNGTGTLLHTYTGEVEGAKGSNLLTVRDGNKYALATGSGLVTQAVYDQIKLKKDSDLAAVKYGDLYGLAGLNGEIISPQYLNMVISGDYATFVGTEKVGVADNTGIIAEGPEDKESAWNTQAVYLYYTEGYFFITRMNGRAYGFDAAGNMYSNQEAWDKWDEYYAKNNPGAEDNANTKEYKIFSNDAGKPCVGYGNKEDGYTPVIEFYQNNMYYDEIEDIGEGYYACRFNTTWYLRHI